MDSLPYVYLPVGPERLERLVEHEIIQRKEEGYDVAEIERKFLEGKRSVSELKRLLKALEESRLRPDFRYREPSDLEGIKAERAGEPERMEIALSDEELYDKIYGGWLGRCAGNLLGNPVEGPKERRDRRMAKVGRCLSA